MKIIKKPNLKIEKRKNISSLNKSVIVLLNNFMRKVDKTNNLNNDADTNDLRAKTINFKRKKTFNSKSKDVKFHDNENKNILQALPIKNGLFNDEMKLNFSHKIKEKECKK